MYFTERVHPLRLRLADTTMHNLISPKTLAYALQLHTILGGSCWLSHHIRGEEATVGLCTLSYTSIRVGLLINVRLSLMSHYSGE